MLLLYMLLNRHRYQRREALATLFWGESNDTRARRCLNSALWRLRHELDGVPELLASNQQGDVRLMLHDEDRLDIAEFEIITRSNLMRAPEALESAELASLEHAVALYQGDLAESCYYDWVLPERERLRALYLDALSLLLRANIRQHAYPNAIATAHQLLQVDPLREDVHRDLMRLYSATDQRGRALQQFHICRQLLQDELHVTPVPETIALYDQLQGSGTLDLWAGGMAPTAPPVVPGNATQQIASSLDRLQQLLQHVQNEIQQTLRALQQLNDDPR